MGSEVAAGGRKRRIALVLAGGAARGAYEVGVVQYLVEEVARALGRPVPLDILSGTSVGALNICGLAALADFPRARASHLVQAWEGLTIDRVLEVDRGKLFALARSLVGRPPQLPADARHGIGLVEPQVLETLIRQIVPFARIQRHIDSGLLHAVTVSTTHVASGRTVVYVAQREPLAPSWSTDPTMLGERVVLEAEHALASAAIPVIFPAVRIGADFYCDGGLRQNVPLSPARRLGADGMVVVSPRYIGEGTSTAALAANESALPSPLFLIGKTLNALLLDHVDSDIDRLRRINSILTAGTRRFGPSFVDELNRALDSEPGRLSLRPLETVLVRSSADIGKMSADYARSPEFLRRNRGMLARILRRMAESDSQSDLLSYLVFDGGLAHQLIELGRADARRQHEELCRFFDTLAPPA